MSTLCSQCYVERNYLIQFPHFTKLNFIWMHPYFTKKNQWNNFVALPFSAIDIINSFEAKLNKSQRGIYVYEYVLVYHASVAGCIWTLYPPPPLPHPHHPTPISVFIQVFFCTSLNGNTYWTKFRLSEDKSSGLGFSWWCSKVGRWADWRFN